MRRLPNQIAGHLNSKGNGDFYLWSKVLIKYSRIQKAEVKLFTGSTSKEAQEHLSLIRRGLMAHVA